MLRRLCLIIIAMLCFLPNTAHSLEAVRVLVLPFEIRAVEDFSYMQTEISDRIKKDLKQEGAVILEPEIIPDFAGEKPTETIEGIRRKFIALSPVMDERMRRQWAASEAALLGWGGVSAVATATGLARNTIQVQNS